jgi:hypothetical protein
MNASMFGKNDESNTASDHLKQKKDIYLYQSRDNNQQHITMSDSNTEINMVKNYDTFLSTVKGYYYCSNSRCDYSTYLDSPTNKIKTNTIDDWYVTQVNYTGVQLDGSGNPLANSEILGKGNWPYLNFRGGEKDCGLKTPYFVKNYTYLKNNVVYVKNRKYIFPKTRLSSQ